MYKHAMIPLDGSKLAECVLPHAESLAQEGKINKVTLVRVVEPLHIRGGLESRLNPEERQHLENDSINLAKEYLEDIAKQLTGKEIKAETEVLYGHAVEKIIEYENNNEVDLVIIATHGHTGISRWVWGSTADRILRSSRIPILMIRACPE